MAGPRKVQIDDLIIDATPEQDFSSDVETTDHPIEDGSNPTDHARARPEVFTATLIVSSVPSDDTDRQQRGEHKPGEGGGYADSVFQKLLQMKNERKLHHISTPLRAYDNMLLTALSAPTRADTGDALVAKVSFKQIRVVQSGTAQFITKTPSTNTQKPTTKKDQGKKQGEEQDISWADQIHESLGGHQ
jgi:hypothetical protein